MVVPSPEDNGVANHGWDRPIALEWIWYQQYGDVHDKSIHFYVVSIDGVSGLLV